MTISHIASRQEWLAARLDLLDKEKAASRQLAALAEQRQRLPAVAVEKDVGANVMLSTYRLLDLTPLGRQRYINEWPWHDTYGASDADGHHD
jgi:predicted dithiol-disulfide oxidoreductase (DUF899 family)